MTYVEIKAHLLRGEWTVKKALIEVEIALLEIKEKNPPKKERYGYHTTTRLSAFDEQQKNIQNVEWRNLLTMKRELEKDIASQATPVTVPSDSDLKAACSGLELQPESVPVPVVEHIEEPIAKSGKEPEPVGRIVWKWGKSDLAWLYDALTSNNAINCGPSAFAALFADKNGLAMPSNLPDFIKDSRNPRRQAMKDISNVLLKYAPDNDRG